MFLTLFVFPFPLVRQCAGFTAWSSAREPSQVFILLETVYRAFDMYVFLKIRRLESGKANLLQQMSSHNVHLSSSSFGQ